jgi:predicted porin
MVLACLAGMSGASQAGGPERPGATLYGVVDAAVAYTNGGTAMIRENSGMSSTSRFGLTATEDLGGGLKAGFRLESSFQADTGVAGSKSRSGDQSLFNRDAHLWIGSDTLGIIRLGKQVPSQIPPTVEPFIAVTGFSPFASLVSGNADLGSGATIGDSRVNNVVSYATPDMRGFGGQVHYAPRENSAPGYPRVADYGMEAHYKSGALLYLGVQSNVINTDPVAGLPSFGNRWNAFGIQYQLGASTLSYELNTVAPRREGYLMAQNHMLGWVYTPRARDTVRAQLMYRNVPGMHSHNALALGLGYEYSLSKATALYTRLGYVLNKAAGISSLANVVPDHPGDDVSVLALGVRLRF